MSMFISLLFVFILIAAAVALGIYFGLLNVDDTAPNVSDFSKSGEEYRVARVLTDLDSGLVNSSRTESLPERGEICLPVPEGKATS
uniref:Uncharacterized protein n=1 Tax=Anopheles coluzzii TaxID=1518534 RepID=A0A8W7P5Y9_ANOCL